MAHYSIIVNIIRVFKFHSATLIMLAAIIGLQLVRHVTNFCTFSENDARLVTLGPSTAYFDHALKSVQRCQVKTQRHKRHRLKAKSSVKKCIQYTVSLFCGVV